MSEQWINGRPPEKKFTVFIAHPDDEVLFCWPVLQEAKRIVCVSSDLHNPERAWCQRRRYCLEEIGRRIGAEVICFDHNSEFYRSSTRDGRLKHIAQEMQRILIAGGGPIFTHNPWGEYGHLDHILCNQIAMATDLEIWTTDIAITIPEAWLPVRPWIEIREKALISEELFASLQAVYSAQGCWTWSFEPALVCGVGRLR